MLDHESGTRPLWVRPLCVPQEGFEAQDRKLCEAQGRVRTAEDRIAALQSELRSLQKDVQDREDQVSRDAAALVALRAQHDDLTRKNQGITEREQVCVRARGRVLQRRARAAPSMRAPALDSRRGQRDAAQRETIREQVRSGQGQVRSGQVRPGQGQAGPGQVRPGQVRPGQARPC